MGLSHSLGIGLLMWRVLGRIVLWTLALLGALAASAFFLIQQQPVQQYVAERALPMLNRRIAGNLALERIGLKLNGQVFVTGVALFDEHGKQILAAERVRAWIAPWDVVRGKVHLLAAEVEQLSGDVQFDSAGVNLARAFKAERKSLPDTTYKPLWIRCDRTSVSIDSLVVRQDGGFTHTLRDWNVSADALLTDSVITYEARINAREQFSAHSRGVARPYSDSLFSGDLDLQSSSQYVISNWSPEFPDLGELSLTVGGLVRKTELAAKFTATVERLGEFNGDLELTDYTAEPRVSAGIKFNDLTLAYWLGDSVAHRFAGRVALTKSQNKVWTHDWLARIELDSSFYGEIAVAADLEAELYENSAFVAGAVRTNSGNFSLRVNSAGLTPDSLSLSGYAELEQAKLHDFIPQIPDTLSPLNGSIEFVYDQPPDSELFADATLALGALSLGKYALDSLAFHATLRGTEFQLDSTRARLGSATALLHARGDYTKEITADGQLTIPELADFRDLLRSANPALDSLSGDLAADFRAVLTIARDSLAAVRAQGELTSEQLSYGAFQARGVTLDVLDVETLTESLNAELAAQSVIAFENVISPVFLTLSGPWQAPAFSCSLATRHDTLRVAASGAFDYSTMPLQLNIESLALNVFGTQWANDFPIELSLDSTHYEVGALVLRSDFGVLRATGYVEQPGTQDVVLEFSGLRTGNLSPLLGSEVPDGALNLRLQVSGPDTAVSGNLELSLDSIYYQDALLADAVTLRAGLANERLAAVVHTLWQGDTALVMQGELPAALSLSEGLRVSQLDSLSGSVRMDSLPLVRLQPWMAQGTRMEGYLSTDVELSGTLERPDWSGSLNLADGFYRDNRYGIAYKWIVLNADLRRDSLYVTSFRATSRGTLTGTGQAKLGVPWPESLDLTLDFDNFEAVSSRIQKARLDGSVHVVGPFDSLNAVGELTVNEGLYRITQSATKTIEPVNLDSVLAELRGDTLETGFDPDAFYTSMAHDLTIKIPGNFWIRGNGLNTELFGDLRLEKTYGLEPTANGIISIRKGTVKFYGQELRIEENSNFRFDGPPDVPELNITAVYAGIDKNRGPFEVTVKLTGTPDQSAAEFSGKYDNGAAMSQDEAVQRLLPFVGSTGGTAEQAVAEAASGQVSDIVGKASGLDVFEFRPGEGGLNDLSTAQLEIGTYVTDRLFIKVFQPIEDPRSGQKVSIDYRLLDWMKFTAEQTSAGEGKPSSSFTVYLQFEWR